MKTRLLRRIATHMLRKTVAFESRALLVGQSDAGQVSGDLTGPTAHITYLASSHDFSGKAIEQFSVKWLVLKFVENSVCILAREPNHNFRESIVSCCHSCSFAGWYRESASSYCAIGLVDAVLI